MSGHRYLPAVDGLRAIAVLAVIVNHTASGWLPSGYLGVDIFFVISGFVITQSLLARPATSMGGLLVDFYGRRVKRLLPALVLVVIVGTLMIRLFDPNPSNSIMTGALALVGASNIFLFSQAIDYFGGSSALNIFTHTWSLGVEEQFYLFYPVLFCLLARRPGNVQVAVISILSLASLVAFVSVVPFNRPAAYFLLPFRFWELSLGCLASILVGPIGEARNRCVRPGSGVVPSVAFAAILISLTLPESWLVATAPLAVIGTTLLLSTIERASWPGRVLSHPALVSIGRISYSLYLWHWLVLCLSIWTIGIHWWSVPFQFAAMFAASAVSYRFVEVPFRYGRWMGSGWRAIPAGAALVAAGLVVVVASRREQWPPFTGSEASVATSKAMAPGYVGLHSGRAIETCRPERLFDPATQVFSKDLDRCRFGRFAPLLVFMGDSHGMDLFAAADLIAARGQASVLNIAQDGCRAPPLPGEAAYCAYQPALIDTLARDTSDVVLILRNNNSPRIIDGSLNHFIEQLRVLLDKAKAANMRIVYIAPAPKYAAVGPTSLCSVQWYRPAWAIGGRCQGDLVEARAEQQATRETYLKALLALQSDRSDFLVFDPFDIYCGTDPTTCTPMREGTLVYRDETHLTEKGSELLAAPLIAALESAGWIRRDRAVQLH